ncbi:Ankyrin repeat protein [Rickettsiales bacterium Ac37b]|nr:Ankyrin repeat protein [Rickettsiales bacterium Ac37b]
MSAARDGRLEISKLLIKNGADVNAISSYQETPLMWAVKNGYLEVLKFFIEKGADITILDMVTLRKGVKVLASAEPKELSIKAFKYYLEKETDSYSK